MALDSMTEANVEGFVRDPEGRLVLRVGGGAALEDGQSFQQGFVRDADGRLVVTTGTDFVAVLAPPATGTFVLTSTEGVLSWEAA